MKRIKNIYEKIYSMDNLRLAHKNARKDKSYYREVKMVDSNMEYYLMKIQDMLKNKTYEVSKYKKSVINDKGKERILSKLPYFPDRIIQWAVMLQLEPMFRKHFVSWSCASQPQKGITKATKLTENYMKDIKGTQYCFKMDVKKFYPNINHSILKNLLLRKIKDKDLLWLLFLIIDSVGSDVGLPIGSYLSQYFANFYLSTFDHWLKEVLHIKYAVRYMDDIIVFADSSYTLHEWRKQIEVYLKESLNLQIKENWQVFKVESRGVDFVGFRHFHGYKLLRKDTYKRMKRVMLNLIKKCKKNQLISYHDFCTVNSYKGWLKWCDSYGLYLKYIYPLEYYVKLYYLAVIKQKGVIV